MKSYCGLNADRSFGYCKERVRRNWPPRVLASIGKIILRPRLTSRAETNVEAERCCKCSSSGGGGPITVRSACRRPPARRRRRRRHARQGRRRAGQPPNASTNSQAERLRAHSPDECGVGSFSSRIGRPCGVACAARCQAARRASRWAGVTTPLSTTRCSMADNQCR